MLKFKSFYYLSESTKDLYRAIGKEKADALLATHQDPKITEIHDKTFGKGNNFIKMPLKNDIPDSVKSHVESNGHKINDEETHVETGKGRPVPIAKYLNDKRTIAPKEVISEYANHQRNQGDHEIVFARGPTVTACSTKKKWDSCANATKIDDPYLAASRLHKDIHHGTLMAMTVKKGATTDDNGEYKREDIDGRVLIKRHDSEEGHTAFVPEDRSYGKFSKAAKAATDEFVNKNYPVKDDIYKKHEDLYDDDGNSKFGTNEAGNEKLRNSRNAKDRLAAIKNKNSTPEQINVALDDKPLNPKDDDDYFDSREVAETAASHKNASPENIHKAIDSNIPGLVHAAVRNPNLTPEHINKALDYDDPFLRDYIKDIKKDAISHKNASPDNIKKAMQDRFESVRQAAIQHKNAPKEMLEKALRNHNADMRIAATKNPKLTPDHIRNALYDDNYRVGESAIKHKNASSENLSEALEFSRHIDIERAAINHDKIQPHHVTLALNSDDVGTRRLAIQHKNADISNMKQGMTDSDEKVSSIATARYNEMTGKQS